MVRICRAGLLNEVVHAVHLVVPGATVLMVVAREVEHARPLNIESEVSVLGKLIEKMACVGALVAAAPVISAAQVSARSEALIGPAFPLAISIPTNRDGWRLLRCTKQAGADKEQQGAPKHAVT